MRKPYILETVWFSINSTYVRAKELPLLLMQLLGRIGDMQGAENALSGRGGASVPRLLQFSQSQLKM